MSSENDPEPLVLGLTTEQMPPLVQVRQWTATGKTVWATVSCDQEGWTPCAGNG